MISFFCFLFASPLIWAAGYQLGWDRGARRERQSFAPTIRLLRNDAMDLYRSTYRRK